MANTDETTTTTEGGQIAPELKRLGVLIGRWRWSGEAKGGTFKVDGETEFEWWPGGHFLVERSALTSDGATISSLVVTGYDATKKACISHSFDNQGQAETFRIGITGDRLDIAWDRYRVSAVIAPDKRTITGAWESSEDGVAWNYWYDMRMEKLDA